MSSPDSTSLLKATPINLFGLLKKGYSVKELVYWGFRVKIWSKLLATLKYSFYAKGRGVEIDHTAVIQGSKRIEIGDGVYVQRNAWLVVPLFDLERVEDRPYLTVGAGTRVGPACTISAAHRLIIGQNVLFGPNVTVLDHRHEYTDINRPVSVQGVKTGGILKIEDNCWLGANSVVFTSGRDITIGRNSVVSANSVVRESVPPYCVVAGNPAVVVRKYNPESGKWESSV